MMIADDWLWLVLKKNGENEARKQKRYLGVSINHSIAYHSKCPLTKTLHLHFPPGKENE